MRACFQSDSPLGLTTDDFFLSAVRCRDVDAPLRPALATAHRVNPRLINLPDAPINVNGRSYPKQGIRAPVVEDLRQMNDPGVKAKRRVRPETARRDGRG